MTPVSEPSEDEVDPVDDNTDPSNVSGEFEYLIGDDGALTIQEAQRECAEWGGSLATLDSAQESRDVFEMLSVEGYYFFDFAGNDHLEIAERQEPQNYYMF